MWVGRAPLHHHINLSGSYTWVSCHIVLNVFHSLITLTELTRLLPLPRRLKELACSLLSVGVEHIWRAVNGIVLVRLFRSSNRCPDHVNFGYSWTNLISAMTTPSVVATFAIETGDALEHVFALVEWATSRHCWTAKGVGSQRQAGTLFLGLCVPLLEGLIGASRIRKWM